MATTLEEFFGDALINSDRGVSKSVREAFGEAISKQIEIASNDNVDTKKAWWRKNSRGYKISPKWQGLTVMQMARGEPASLSCSENELISKLKLIAEANSKGIFDERLEEIRKQKKSAQKKKSARDNSEVEAKIVSVE